jgi:hypothetical protein
MELTFFGQTLFALGQGNVGCIGLFGEDKLPSVVIKLPNQSWVLLKGFRSCKSGSKIVTDL